MANNSTLPATGDVVRDIDRTGVKTQVVGIDVGIGTGTEALMSAANPMPVYNTTALPAGTNIVGALVANQSVNNAQVNGIAVQTGTGAAGTGTQRVAVANDSSLILAAGTADIGGVIAREAQSFPTLIDVPGTSTSAYAAGDQFGTLITIPNAARASGGTGRINSVLFYDELDLMGAISIVFFRDTVTLAADNAAFTISAADTLKVLGVVDIVSVNDLGSGRFMGLVTSIPYECVGTSLYAACIIRTAPTLGSTLKQHVRLGLTRD